jgi:hypothetical protein
MKKLLAIVAAFVLTICCVGLVACGSGKVEGTYKFKSMTTKMGDVETTVTVGQEVLGLGTLTEDYMVIELKEGGAAAVSNAMGGQAINLEGTWAQEGSDITITMTGETQVFKLNGNQLSITESEAGMEMTIVLQK